MIRKKRQVVHDIPGHFKDTVVDLLEEKIALFCCNFPARIDQAGSEGTNPAVFFRYSIRRQYFLHHHTNLVPDPHVFDKNQVFFETSRILRCRKPFKEVYLFFYFSTLGKTFLP